MLRTQETLPGNGSAVQTDFCRKTAREVEPRRFIAGVKCEPEQQRTLLADRSVAVADKLGEGAQRAQGAVGRRNQCVEAVIGVVAVGARRTRPAVFAGVQTDLGSAGRGRRQDHAPDFRVLQTADGELRVRTKGAGTERNLAPESSGAGQKTADAA